MGPLEPSPAGRRALVWPGMLLSLGAGIACTLAAACGLRDIGLPATTAAILAGLAASPLVRRSEACSRAIERGLEVTRTTLLRTAIVVYGLRIGVDELLRAGTTTVVASLLVLVSTFVLALWLGRRLGLAPETCVLVGAGSSVCGAAAVIAASSVTGSSPRQIAPAVAMVVLFGTAGMLLYPLAFHAGGLPSPLLADPQLMGAYIGATLHEVAQVAAAAEAVDSAAQNSAMIAKMTRVLMLAPLICVVALLTATASRPSSIGRGAGGGALRAALRSIPWFAPAFLVVVLASSWLRPPDEHRALAITIGDTMMASAMFAIGVSTSLRDLVQGGRRVLLLGLALAAWLAVGGAALVIATHA